MITRPKNAVLQVFNALVFEARSKRLLRLSFVLVNAGCIKSPPSPRPVCSIQNYIYSPEEEEVLFCTAEAVEGLGIFTQVFNAVLIAP